MRAAEGDTPRRVRTSRILQGLGGEGLPPWFLLANGTTRCRSAGEALQRLPTLLQAPTYLSGGPQDYSTHLAIRCVGPFKTAPGGLTHLLVAVDKFTKWIKAKPIKKLDGSSTIKFFNEIIMRYGVPHSIITDNGTNFAKGVFAEFYSQKGIRLDLASVAHP
jgi:hypothetical protein